MRPIEVLLLIGACAQLSCATGGPLTALRLYNRDPVRIVQDRLPIPCPGERTPQIMTEEIDGLVRRRALHRLAMPDPVHALDVNSLDDAPDSTWFTNRIGVRELSVDEVARGPNDHPPDRSRPFRVHEVSISAKKPRFVVEDAQGARFMLKFDALATPELETGPEVVVQRLLWAAGFNVPENSIIEVTRADFTLADKAVYKLGVSEQPLTRRDFERALALAAPTADGRALRALASRFIEGKPLGGYPMEGVRADDANDQIPHQHRRVVRGQRMFFAWLAQTDVKEPNTLDTWLEREGSGYGYVKHYLLDFGKALGTWGRTGHEHDGYAPHFDYAYAFAGLLSFGFWSFPWERLNTPEFRGLGRYEAAGFRPTLYAEANPYAPFLWTDAFDDFWSAKILARIRPEHIATAVRQARYSDPRTSAYLWSTMIRRKRKIVRYAFRRVNPLDGFEVSSAGAAPALCFRDLMLEQQLAAALATRYRIESFDYDGRPLGPRRSVAAQTDGRTCVPGLAVAQGREGYTLVAIWTTRNDATLAPVIVHLARRPSDHMLRVIGVERRG